MQMGMGIFQTAMSAAAASKLPESKKITVSPEMQLAYNMSRRRAEEGHSPEEKAQFEQMLARQGTATKQMLQNVGLAGIGSAAANIMGVDAMNQFAAQGSANKRASFGQFANMAQGIQGVKTAETNRFNAELNAERKALGMATKTGTENMFKGMQSMGVSGQNATAMDIWKNMGKSDDGLMDSPNNQGYGPVPKGTRIGFDESGEAASFAPTEEDRLTDYFGGGSSGGGKGLFGGFGKLFGF